MSPMMERSNIWVTGASALLVLKEILTSKMDAQVGIYIRSLTLFVYINLSNGTRPDKFLDLFNYI